MTLVDYIAVAVILLLVGAASVYIIREKKKGCRCIGCPHSSSCSGACACCTKQEDTDRSHDVTIKKVDKDTEDAAALLEYVKNFSWEEVREHTVRVIENWEFEEWEAPFVAMADGRIAGMVTVMKTDYYPLPEIYPWISTLFVSEEYRGKRISEKLIDFANSYAKDLGFDKTYIPSSHVGLYEKYGYSYIKDIVNYGGDVDRLYAKELRQ